MKKYFLPLLFMFSVGAKAQFGSLPIQNDLSRALARVLADYPNHFNNIKGSIIDQGVQNTDYACSVIIQGADSSVVTRIGTEQDSVYTWKCVLLQTDDENKAKAKFHEYFNHIKPTVASVHYNRIELKGEYEAPDDNKKFATILFTPKPESDFLENVVVDLSMQYLTGLGWQVSVSVYASKEYGMNN